MDITIKPGLLQGTVAAIPSKSQAHRLLICASFADKPTALFCPHTNRDIEATANCLRALGANICYRDGAYHIQPIKKANKTAVLDCGESGSTLRFMLPIAGALGVEATFVMAGRLPQRPLSPLWEEMERMGCNISRPTPDTIRCTGQLQKGNYSIDGSVSSQFITGLLFALSLIEGESKLDITGTIESKPYIEMTKNALAIFGAPNYRSPGEITVEGDWSNGAFWLAANALGSDLTVTGLDGESAQGDRAAAQLLQQLVHGHTDVYAADIPDLVPILSVVAAAKHGAVFHDIQRLRLKESDRVESVISLLHSIGVKAEATQNTITVYPATFTGGTIDACSDHRIAMAAAVAATVCNDPVTILGAQCVEKSYPGFWDEFTRLGGCI